MQRESDMACRVLGKKEGIAVVMGACEDDVWGE